MVTQAKFAKDIINGCTKMELVVALFFKVHPYLEPTNDTNEAKFILAFDKDDDPSLEDFNGDLQQSFTKLLMKAKNIKET